MPFAMQSTADVVELIAKGASLREVLEGITLLVEAEVEDGAVCSILILDAARGELLVGAGPHLPAGLAAVCQHLKIGDGVGSCGTAAFRGERVLTADLDHDLSWAAFKHLAVPFGLAACWSIPILSRTARDAGRPVVLGTFAVYSPRKGLPDERAERILRRAVQLASIALESAAAARAVAASDARTRSMLDNASDAVFIHDEAGVIVDVNRAACESLGYTRDELVGQLPSLFDPAVTRESLDAMAREFETERTIAFEAVHRRKDGHVFPVEIRIGNIVTEGLPVRRVAIVRDITARKANELALRRSEDALRRAQELAHVGHWSYDVTRDALSGSDEAWRIFGLTPGEHPFEAWAATLHSDDRDAVLTAWTGARAGTPFALEHRILRGGQTRWVDVRAEIVRDSSGRVTEVNGVVKDQTDRRRLETELRQTQKMEAIGRLAGGVAHDFNNLLTIINGVGDDLLEALPPDSPLREDVATIVDAGQRAASLTAQLLAFGRRAIVKPTVIDLNETVRRLSRLFGRVLGEDIALEVVLAAESVRVDADQAQIDQVVMNLVLNARDAMPDGGTIRIETESVRGSGGEPLARLRVADTGEGMPESVRERVFEPFFTTKAGRGAGLGLATVYAIVEEARGSVRVESTPGLGTTFSVELPASVRAAEPTTGRAPKPGGGAETILVAEDETQVRKLVVRGLRGYGYTVIEAASGEDAVVAFEAEGGRVDLLLTDVMMPGMGGRALASLVRARQPEVSVVFMSGHTDDAVVRQGISQATDPFVQKPFNVSTLARRIREVLDRARRAPGPA